MKQTKVPHFNTPKPKYGGHVGEAEQLEAHPGKLALNAQHSNATPTKQMLNITESNWYREHTKPAT